MVLAIIPVGNELVVTSAAIELQNIIQVLAREVRLNARQLSLIDQPTAERIAVALESAATAAERASRTAMQSEPELDY